MNNHAPYIRKKKIGEEEEIFFLTTQQLQIGLY